MEKRSKLILIFTLFTIFMALGILAVKAEKTPDSASIDANTKNIFTSATKKSPTAGKQAAKKKTSSAKKKPSYMVAIDAGHQLKGNSNQEPIGPGAKTKKNKVTSGTTGRETKIPEYQITLEVALKLEKVLKDRGYEVVMIRDKHNVDISNAERAEIANEANADIFIRLHCNGDQDRSINGALTMRSTKKNPYCKNNYSKSKSLSESVLEELCDATGAKKRSIIETDTMSGINWCKMPVTIVEMGFLTNKKEEGNLTDSKYQDKLAKGIANGIDEYFKQ